MKGGELGERKGGNYNMPVRKRAPALGGQGRDNAALPEYKGNNTMFPGERSVGDGE